MTVFFKVFLGQHLVSSLADQRTCRRAGQSLDVADRASGYGGSDIHVLHSLFLLVAELEVEASLGSHLQDIVVEDLVLAGEACIQVALKGETQPLHDGHFQSQAYATVKGPPVVVVSIHHAAAHGLLFAATIILESIIAPQATDKVEVDGIPVFFAECSAQVHKDVGTAGDVVVIVTGIISQPVVDSRLAPCTIEVQACSNDRSEESANAEAHCRGERLQVVELAVKRILHPTLNANKHVWQSFVVFLVSTLGVDGNETCQQQAHRHADFQSFHFHNIINYILELHINGYKDAV